MPEQPSIPGRLAALARHDPEAAAVTDAQGTLTRIDLELASNRFARGLLRRGVGPDDLVSISTTSNRDFVIAALACWKIGATPQPLSPRLTTAELVQILELARPATVISGSLSELPGASGVPVWDGAIPADVPADPLPDMLSRCWKAPTSGGSSGTPKIILSTEPAHAAPLMASAELLRIRTGDVALIPAPLHHNGPFVMTTMALLQGAHVLLMERFDPQRLLTLVTDHQVTWLYAVPTIMGRVSKLPAEVVEASALAGVRTLLHMAAPCPPWLKQWWIDRLGAEAVWELYAGTEAQATTLISGTEWLERPGSVGRPVLGEVTVLDEKGARCRPGTIGEVYLRSGDGRPTYRYMGAQARRSGDWESLGDLGWLDEQGYLFLADRATDMVVVGGVNVYPAEVEAALDAHPHVESSCVVGLPDDDLGHVLHAVVRATADIDEASLLHFLSDRLAPFKTPRTFSWSQQPLRDEAGKVRRSQVRAACLAARERS